MIKAKFRVERSSKYPMRETGEEWRERERDRVREGEREMRE